jgi:murein DD-endopeptidase MepM/ murein hydrolase activator NlpD
MIVADAGQTVAPRFISLNAARQGLPSTARVSTPMRSDRAALQGGFLRMDRARASIVNVPRQVTITKPEPSITTPKGEDSAVLDLFDDASDDLTLAPTLGRIAHAWPLPKSASQKFTSGYGTRKDPITGKPAFHSGIDIAAAVGTDVLASAEGTVTKVENGSGFGKYVSVKHRDGSESTYGHLSAQAVRVGQHVRQGQKLGALGSTGRSTGPHLDYRLKKGTGYVNPMTVLKAPTNTGVNVATNNNNRHVSTINGVKIIR